MKESFVYFIRGGDLIKIGTSVNPSARLREMQTGNAAELELLGSFKGTRRTEYELHKRFGHLRMRGEWFLIDDALREEIERLLTSPSDCHDPTIYDSGYEAVPGDEDQYTYHSGVLSMFYAAWRRFCGADDPGPLVRKWFEELYELGTGGWFSLYMLLNAGTLLSHKTDKEQRAILIAEALADNGFCDNVTDVAERWLREISDDNKHLDN